MQPLRVCLVDSNGITRKGIATTLRQSNLATETVEAMSSLSELLELMDFERFDILLLDDAGESVKTLSQTIKTVLKKDAMLKIIVLSTRLKVALVQQSIQAGARGFMYKQDDLDHALLTGIYTVNRDLVYHSPKISELLSNHNQLVTLNNLKPIDIKVLRLTAQGLTVKAIAAELEISTRSVYRSRDKLREVLDVPTIEKLLDAAREQGLLDCD